MLYSIIPLSNVWKERVPKGTDSWNKFIFIKKGLENQRVLFFQGKITKFLFLSSLNNLHRHVNNWNYDLYIFNVYC